MRTKTVLRHYCDHCNRGMFKKAAMVKHESNCIRNPLRTCIVCDKHDLKTTPMPELLAALEQTLDALRTAAHGCPACMLAAIVQAKGEVRKLENPETGDVWGGFDYRAETALFESRRDAGLPTIELF